MPGAESIEFAGTQVEILVPGEVSDGRFALLRLTNPPGVWTPPHRHRREEETVYVLAGSLIVETQSGMRVLRAGEVAFLPRGGVHRLGNDGPAPAMALLLCTPSGFERFVREAGESVPPEPAEVGARLAALAPGYGIDLL
jgi:quercetin dioxygenase-like cupin family protein